MTARYSVIVATYNESENLPILIDQISQAFAVAKEKGVEIIVVDDNSPDGTAAVAEQLRECYPELNIELLRRPRKLGLGTAYIAGLQKCSGEFVFILDADLSHQPRFMPEMMEVQRKGEYDIVSGTRYSNGGGVVGWPFKRRLISCVSNQIVMALFSPPATDVTGSFRLYKKSALKTICESMEATGFSFQCEAILRATRLNMKIANVPIEFVERVFGTSNFCLREAVLFLLTLARLVWHL